MSEELQPNENSQEELTTGLKILSFCAPIAGVIIYFMNKDEHPKKAKTACYASLIGVGVILVLTILFTVLGFIGAAAGAASGGY